jgi:nucleotide-binding universal stress UspA family protein
MAVEERMREEAREEAERLLYDLAQEANTATGLIPEITIREGEKKEEILAFIRDEPDIRLLVLGAGTGREGPGPLVSSLAGDIAGLYTVPVTIVPGGMSLEAIDAIA